MLKRMVFVLCLALLVSCATNNLEIKPIGSVSTYLPLSSFDSLEIIGGEVWLKKGGILVGTFQSIKKQDEYKSAVAEVKAGFETMKGKGGIEMTTEPSTYGFYAETENFRTFYVAHQKDNDYWALISIKKDLIDASTLGFIE